MPWGCIVVDHYNFVHSFLGWVALVTIVPLFTVRYVLRQSGTIVMVTGCCLCAESNGIRVTRLRAGRSRFRIPVRSKRFFCPPKRPDRLWVASSLLLNWYQVCFPGIKRPGREVKHSRSSSAEVKNKGRCTCSFPLCLYDVDRENFTF
jgi:hypothetical protein